jgi:hypothetical protein
VSLILAYISFGYSADLPLAGALGSSVTAASLFCMIALLCVMTLGLECFANGLLSCSGAMRGGRAWLPYPAPLAAGCR